MEIIEQNSVILNWNHEDAAIDPTPGDTTVITNKDDNDELMVGNSTSDSSNSWEGECPVSESVIESSKNVGDKRKLKANHWTELYDETTQMYPFKEFKPNTQGYKSIELAKILQDSLDLCDFRIIAFLLNRSYGGNFRDSSFSQFNKWVKKYFDTSDLSCYGFPDEFWQFEFLEKLDKANKVARGKNPASQTKNRTKQSKKRKTAKKTRTS